MCYLVWAGGNACLEEVKPGLSSEEVRLVEKGEATARAGMAARELADNSTHQADQEDPGKAGPAPQSRAGEGRAGGREQTGSLPGLPHQPASSDFSSSLLAPRLFLASGF